MNNNTSYSISTTNSLTNTIENFNSNNHKKIDFCDIIEIDDISSSINNVQSLNEVLKSYSNYKSKLESRSINDKKNSNIDIQPTQNSSSEFIFNVSTQSKFLTKNELIEKYLLDPKSINDGKDKLFSTYVKNILFNKPDLDKERNELEIFIKNCIKYGYERYLDSTYFFNDKVIRNRIINPYELEHEFQSRNKDNVKNIIMDEVNVKKRYEELMKKHSYKYEIPNEILSIYQKAKYKLMNHLADSDEFNKKI